MAFVTSFTDLRQLANRLLYLGTAGYPPDTRRRLAVVNFMAYLIVSASINYAVIYASFGVEKYAPLIAINLLHICFALMVPVLHRVGENAGAYFIVVFEYISLFFLTAFLGTESGIQTNYIIAAAVPFLALDRSRLLIITCIIIGAFILHMTSTFFAPDAGLLIKAEPLLLVNIYLLSAVTTFGLISFIVYYALTTKDRAEARINDLLNNILPGSIAERLKNDPTANIAEYYPQATVMFVDTVGYTELSQQMGPEKTVALLNDVFSAFDALAEKCNVEKIKTVGDAYMVVGGAPSPLDLHVEQVATMALLLRDAVKKIADKHNVPLDLRVGIATGPIIGGVIGRRKLVFDVWGDTVNLAARLESNSMPGRIHISSDVADILRPGFEIEPSEPVELKGFGLVETAFLVSKHS